MLLKNQDYFIKTRLAIDGLDVHISGHGQKRGRMHVSFYLRAAVQKASPLQADGQTPQISKKPLADPVFLFVKISAIVEGEDICHSQQEEKFDIVSNEIG